MTELKTVTIHVEDDVYAAVESVAARRNMSANQLVIEYLRSLRDEKVSHAERTRRLDELFRWTDDRPQSGPVGTFRRDEVYRCDGIDRHGAGR